MNVQLMVKTKHSWVNDDFYTYEEVYPTGNWAIYTSNNESHLNIEVNQIIETPEKTIKYFWRFWKETIVLPVVVKTNIYWAHEDSLELRQQFYNICTDRSEGEIK